MVCSVKDDRLKGLKLLIVQEYDVQLKATYSFHVAADTVQAGNRRFSIICVWKFGNRQTEKTTGKAIDCAIIAVVDQVNLNT